MQFVILAGGKGTRLRSKLGELPKPMAPIGGRPLLEHQIELARRYGFDEIILLVGHGREAIEAWAGDGSRFGVRIRAIGDGPPRGNAGAVMAALERLDSRFLVVYGDTMLNVDLSRFWSAHAKRGSAVSLLIHPNDHPWDSDLIETDRRDFITAFRAAPGQASWDYRNQVNAGLYIVEREALAGMPRCEGVLDFGTDLLPGLLARGFELFGYRSPEYIKDAGTPERLDAVNVDWESGRIARGSFATPVPAIFLDRDGTINRDANYVRTPDALELLTGVAGAIRGWNSAGWRVVVVSNQPVIARGDCTEEGLLAIHNRMETQLGLAGAYVDGIYYCPHHPDGGFTGEKPELKTRCNCRKPATALILQASRDLNIDLNRSWMVGDSTTDIRTARNAGIRSVLVRTGKGGLDGLYPDLPDLIARDLSEAMHMTIALHQGAGR
ncbi:MAG: HAD-IIIA family hydrolase [Candidatus Sulfopaludibacter sp.]|nr:HAD-IIIA family hydrolase [Candidatus Sulfopaludibacter sp.]